VVITLAHPSITISPQPASVAVGTSISDQATVTGGFNPTGTVTFNLYNNPNGTGTPFFTDTQPLVNGAATSKSYTVIAAGTYYWVATYNGDANNNPVSTGTADEPVVITRVSPSITGIQQPTTAIVESPIGDKATVSGGFNPTGTVTFRLYDNPNGSGTPLFTDTENMVNGKATTSGYTTVATGKVYWVATYNGDANNNSVSSRTADQPVTIVPVVTANCPAVVSSGGQAYPVQGVAITPVTLVGSAGCGGPYTFSATGLPTGLTMSAAGTISGTPTVVGSVFNYTVMVTDGCANSGTANCSVNVGYNWSGFLSPFPKQTYKSGSSIPIKFMLSGASGGIKNLVATGWVAPVNNNVVGTYTPIGTFRYDPPSGNYVLNWSTKPAISGTFRIKTDLGDGVLRTVDVILK
jgi:hypothetical protein